jgi:hypothetical protein
MGAKVVYTILAGKLRYPGKVTDIVVFSCAYRSRESPVSWSP